MLRQALLVMLSVCLVLSFAVWLLQALRLIDLIVNRGLSVGVFLHLAILILPRFIVVVLPIAVFVAVLFVYNKLIAESELVVMRAAGVGPLALARPALITGALGMVFLFALTLYLLPAANRSFKDLQFEIRNRFASILIQDGVFNTISDRLMVYVRSRDADGELAGILIYDNRQPDKPVTVFAERGAIANTKDGPRLLLVNGTRQQRTVANGHLAVLHFDKYTLELTELSDMPGVRDRQVDEQFTTDLVAGLRTTHEPEARRSMLAELNMRLAAPLSALTMAVLPLACLLTGEFNRRGQGRRILLAVLLAMAIEILDVGLKNVAARSTDALPLIYINLALPLAASFWLLLREARPRERARLGMQPAE